MEIKTLLIGTDGSSRSQAAVAFGSLLAAQLGARVVLVHASGLLEQLPESSAESSVPLRSQIERSLTTTWSDPLRTRGVPVECVLEDGPPILVLPRVAERVGADMIVIGSHGSGNAIGLPLGSTADGTTRESSLPILVVPNRT